MRARSGMAVSVGVAVVFFAAGCGSSNGGTEKGTGGGKPLGAGETHDGIITYYAADGSGACSFDPSSDLDVTALNAEEWSGSANCGACVDVTGPDGTVRVRIVDLCPECKKGHLDLSESAFAKIAKPELGRVDVEWKLVSCDVAGAMHYKYKDGSNPYWTAIQIRNHRVPIAKVEWSKDGAEYIELTRTDYNYFLTESGFGSDPVQIRVTGSTGEVLEDDLPAVADSLEVTGKVQFR